MSDDRLSNIKKVFDEADAAGRVSADSPTRWLLGEVERLRAAIGDMPTAEIQSCAVYANQSRHPGIVADAKTVLVWFRKEVLGR